MTDYNSTQIYDTSVSPPALINQTTLAAISGSITTGSLIFLGSVTGASGATADFNNLFSSAYEIYLVFGEDILGATNATELLARFGTGATPTYQATNYQGSTFEVRGTTQQGRVASTTSLSIGPGPLGAKMSNAANKVANFDIVVSNVRSASNFKSIFSKIGFNESTTAQTTLNISYCQWLDATVVTSIRFLFSSGNFSSGNIYLYGVKPS